jgi:hypothetical protein
MDEMKIIKEYVRQDREGWFLVILRTGTYGHSLAYFLGLAEQAAVDFPGITLGDVSITHYGGRHYTGTFGIEFPTMTKPGPEYTELQQVEQTL